MILTSDLCKTRTAHRIATSAYYEPTLNMQMHISETTAIWLCDIAKELSRYGDAIAVTSSLITAQDVALRMKRLMEEFGHDLSVVIGSKKSLPDSVLEGLSKNRRYCRVNLEELPTALLRNAG